MRFHKQRRTGSDALKAELRSGLRPYGGLGPASRLQAWCILRGWRDAGIAYCPRGLGESWVRLTAKGCSAARTSKRVSEALRALASQASSNSRSKATAAPPSSDGGASD